MGQDFEKRKQDDDATTFGFKYSKGTASMIGEVFGGEENYHKVDFRASSDGSVELITYGDITLIIRQNLEAAGIVFEETSNRPQNQEV